MGRVVEGKWTEDDNGGRIKGGRFERAQSAFRDFISADGATGFAAAKGRYHLYVAVSCPWAHRTVLFRRLKGLEDVIPVIWCARGPDISGWHIDGRPHKVPGTGVEIDFLYQLYTLARTDYSGRVTVPTLWDSEQKTIVNNESAEIIRMFNAAFAAFAEPTPDFYPRSLRDEIDSINDTIYQGLNNGVYRAGFATSQDAYDEAYDRVFETLDALEQRLGHSRYLCGERQTEADWRLFPTLLRFDAVYYSHFKCNRQRIMDFPNLSNYLRDLYQTPGIAAVCDIERAKRGYYQGQRKLNPTGIVPRGPVQDLGAPHDRDRFGRAGQ
jgi:glutathionyl-hydroquinone reductase